MSLALILDMAAGALDDRVALGARESGPTYAAVADRSARLAALIAAHEPTQVVYIGRNGPHFPQLLFASALAAVPFAPMNYRLSPSALGELVGGFERPLVIVEDDLLDTLGPALPAAPTRLSGLLADIDQAEPLAPRDIDPDDTAVLLFTSGTTSKPKAVVLTHQNLLSYILSTVDLAVADPDEAALVSVPPYHVAGIGSALSNFYAGRRVVHLPDFDARQWLDLVAGERITSAMVVPTMLARIVDELGTEPAEAPALRLISYGGAKTPLPVLERALAAFPTTGFCNAYGLTETSSTLALLGPDDHREAIASSDPAVVARLGSVGRPVPGVEVEVRDASGHVVGAGEAGEIYVRGAQVSGRYEGIGSALDEAGWFPTRDLGHLDAGGYLFISGRADDTIIRGGENISPAEVEDVLFRHPAVREAAVIGLPDEEWGQRLVAVLVASGETPAPDADEIRAFVRAALRGSRTPDQVVWVSELPTTATGKLVRRDLVTRLSEPDSATTNAPAPVASMTTGGRG